MHHLLRCRSFSRGPCLGRSLVDFVNHLIVGTGTALIVVGTHLVFRGPARQGVQATLLNDDGVQRSIDFRKCGCACHCLGLLGARFVARALNWCRIDAKRTDYAIQRANIPVLHVYLLLTRVFGDKHE